MLFKSTDPEVAKTFFRENRAIKRTIKLGIALVASAVLFAAAFPERTAEIMLMITGHR